MTKTTKVSILVHRRGIIKVLKTMVATMNKGRITTRITIKQMDTSASHKRGSLSLQFLLHTNLDHHYQWVIWPVQHQFGTTMANNLGLITRLLRLKASFLTTKQLDNQFLMLLSMILQSLKKMQFYHHHFSQHLWTLSLLSYLLKICLQ